MPVLSSPTIPTTLAVATPAEGFTLARRLAESLVAATGTVHSVDMPVMLRPSAASRPSVELVAAIYFHAISIANAGWRD